MPQRPPAALALRTRPERRPGPWEDPGPLPPRGGRKDPALLWTGSPGVTGASGAAGSAGPRAQSRREEPALSTEACAPSSLRGPAMPAPTGPQGRCLLVPMRLEPRLPGLGHSRCFPHACGTRAGTRQWGVGPGLAPRPLWMPRGKELGAQLQTEAPPGPGGGGRPDSRPGIHLLSLAPSPTTSEGLTACLPSFLPPFPHQHPAHSPGQRRRGRVCGMLPEAGVSGGAGLPGPRALIPSRTAPPG